MVGRLSVTVRARERGVRVMSGADGFSMRVFPYIHCVRGETKPDEGVMPVPVHDTTPQGTGNWCLSNGLSWAPNLAVRRVRLTT